MTKIISDYKIFKLRQNGYRGDVSIAGMIEYLQDRRMFVKLREVSPADPDICEKLYILVRDSLK